MAHPRFGGEIVAQALRPSAEAFHGAYEADDYRPWRDLRHRVAETRIALVPATRAG